MYTGANTPQLSDSFPGILALITGGSPVTTGLFYDVSYDRTIFASTNTTCTGGAGNMMVFDESIDKYNSQNVSLNVIDPTMLPRHMMPAGSRLSLPADSIMVRTASKHPITDAGIGSMIDKLLPVAEDNERGDVHLGRLKVQGIINEIHGLTHDGKPGPGVPEVFGMNFQGVSVGQKLSTDNYDGSCVADNGALNGLPGGYQDGSGTPTRVLAYALDQTDAAISAMVQSLKDQNIYDSTLFIVTSKHGQSPINPVKTNKPGHFADLVGA